MLEYRIPLASFASTVIFGVCFVIALIFISSSTSGRAKTFGVLGILSIFASTALQGVNRSLSAVYGTDALVYQVGSCVVAAFAAGGLVLVALAIARSRRAKSARGEL